MLVSQYGRIEVTISGGCLEDDVARKAWLSESGPVIRSYSTAEATDEEGGEEAFGYGLGCNGKPYVLFERIPAANQSALVNGRPGGSLKLRELKTPESHEQAPLN